MSNPTTTQPSRPAPTVLRQTGAGRLPTYTDRAAGRFTVVRNDSFREGRTVVVPFEDSGYTVTDTKRANLLGHADRNWVIVFELDDVRAVIDRVLYREYLTALAKWQDAERVRLGLPTVLEEARMAAAARAQRARTAV